MEDGAAAAAAADAAAVSCREADDVAGEASHVTRRKLQFFLGLPVPGSPQKARSACDVIVIVIILMGDVSLLLLRWQC